MSYVDRAPSGPSKGSLASALKLVYPAQHLVRKDTS